MNEQIKILKERIVLKATNWRESDQSEPIGSDVPHWHLMQLAYAVDDLKEALLKINDR